MLIALDWLCQGYPKFPWFYETLKTSRRLKDHSMADVFHHCSIVFH